MTLPVIISELLLLVPVKCVDNHDNDILQIYYVYDANEFTPKTLLSTFKFETNFK